MSPAVQQVIPDTHAPESAWQAVNRVWSFICQSPPKCHTGRAIPHNTVPQPPPAVWLNGFWCLKASVHSLSHALQRRMMSLRRLQKWVQSNTWWRLSNTSAFFHQVYLAASAMSNPHSKFILQTFSMVLREKTAKWSQWCFQKETKHSDCICFVTKNWKNKSNMLKFFLIWPLIN